jgi:hypothetical protein
MENVMKKDRFLDAKNLPKYETVIDFMLFSHWRKGKKIDAEMIPKMDEKSSKNRCGSGLGRFIL